MCGSKYTIHVIISLFADDTRITIRVSSAENDSGLPGATDNNLVFFRNKFRLLHYKGNEEITTCTEHRIQININTSRKRRVKGIGIIISDALIFFMHIKATFASLKMVGWILQTFKTRKRGEKKKRDVGFQCNYISLCANVTSSSRRNCSIGKRTKITRTPH